MKAKHWFYIVIGLIVLVGGIWGTREVYYYYNPNVIISYRVQESEDLYYSLPSYAIEPKSQFGYSAKYDEEMRAWWEATNEIEVWLHTDFVKPIHVTSDIEIVDGRTDITYIGTATLPNGEKVNIDEQVSLDFVVSGKAP